MGLVGEGAYRDAAFQSMGLARLSPFSLIAALSFSTFPPFPL
jgi:hypothetical protein